MFFHSVAKLFLIDILLDKLKLVLVSKNLIFLNVLCLTLCSAEQASDKACFLCLCLKKQVNQTNRSMRLKKE